MTHARPELRALTGLRFLAAFHVLVFHALFTFSRASVVMTALGRGALRPLLASGYVGVNFFFALSGFVLAYTYVEDGKMTTTAARFWRARFARVYPMHLLGVLLALSLFVLGSAENHAQGEAIAQEGAKEVALCLLLMQAWVPAHVFDLNGPSWSLSVEALFYALFPLLVRLLGRLRERGLAAIAVVAWVLALLPPLLHEGPAGPLARMTALDLALLHDPLVRLPDFVIGLRTGLVFLRRHVRAVAPGEDPPHLSPHLARRARPGLRRRRARRPSRCFVHRDRRASETGDPAPPGGARRESTSPGSGAGRARDVVAARAGRL